MPTTSSKYMFRFHFCAPSLAFTPLWKVSFHRIKLPRFFLFIKGVSTYAVEVFYENFSWSSCFSSKKSAGKFSSSWNGDGYLLFFFPLLARAFATFVDWRCGRGWSCSKLIAMEEFLGIKLQSFSRLISNE